MSINKESWTDKTLLKAADRLEKFPTLIQANRWKILLLFLGITGFFLAGIPNFKINQSLDAFFQEEDKTLKNYNWLKFVYGSDEFVMVMFEPKNKDVFSKSSLEALDKIEREINRQRNLPGSKLNRIVRVRTIISADYLESKGDTLISRPFIGDRLPQNEQETELLRRAAQSHPDFPGQFISKNSQFGIMLLLTDFASRPVSQIVEDTELSGSSGGENSGVDEFDFDLDDNNKTAKLLTLDEIPEIESIQMDDYPIFVHAFEKVFETPEWKNNFNHYLAGNPIIMTFFSEIIIKELGMYGGLSLLIIWTVMIIIYRSFSAMVWPSITLISTILWTIGLIGWTNSEMTFMINIIVILLLAVSMATSIHIMSGYGYFLKKGKKEGPALEATYRKSGIPIVLAAMTTSAGLFSLSMVDIPSIQKFGTFAGVGVLLTLVVNLVMWPVFISFWAPKLNERNINKTSLLAKFLATQRDRTLQHQKLIIAVFAVTAMFMGSGISKILIDTNFIEMIKEGYNVTESYKIIDKHFGGTAQLDILVNSGKPDGVKSVSLLNAIDDFTAELKRERGDIVSRISSIVSAVKESHKNLTDGSQKNYSIPDTDIKVAQVLVNFESVDPTSRKLMVEDNWQVARVSVKMVTKGTYDYRDLLVDIDKLADKHFGKFKKAEPAFEVKYTGGVHLMTELLTLIATSQIRSFSIALIVISVMLFLLFGSIKFGFLAMIPNVFPIVIVLGYAGWMGIPLDNDTLLVIPIAIGIAVDDTIHFLTHYRSELLDGLSSSEAISSALQKVGIAMTMTTLVLTAGYLVYLFSAYKPLTNFGILSAIAVSSALLADLFLLPVLIHLAKPFSTKETKMDNSKNKNKKSKTLVTATSLFLLIASQGILSSPTEAIDKKAHAIAKRMTERQTGKSSYGKTVLISCDFTTSKSGKRSCKSGKRKKVFESVSQEQEKGTVKKSLSILIEPANERGVSFLQTDYEKTGDTSEQWIYLPALKKKKRIVSASNSGPKTGTFFGSEIAYEEMEKRHLKDYDSKYIGEGKIEKTPVWIIEMRANRKKKGGSSYSKSKLWIDKKKDIALKIEMYDKQNRLAKTFISRKIEKDNGIWISKQQIVVNHKNNRMSMMQSTVSKINIDFPESLLSQRSLTDQDFRSKELKKLR